MGNVVDERSKRKEILYFFLCLARILRFSGGESNSMGFGGGVTRTLGIGDSNPLVMFSLKVFSAACMFPPVLQAKLDISLCADELHFGHTGVQFALNASLSSNSFLHWEQIYSYIGILSSFRYSAK